MDVFEFMEHMGKRFKQHVAYVEDFVTFVTLLSVSVSSSGIAHDFREIPHVFLLPEDCLRDGTDHPGMAILTKVDNNGEARLYSTTRMIALEQKVGVEMRRHEIML